MIVTVTANLAFDRTYVVRHLEVGEVHKVRKVYAQAGGKGVNVSRALADLGAQTLVAGLVGADSKARAEADLEHARLRAALYSVSGSGRQTVTVDAEDGTTTAFDEPGPTVSDAEWLRFEEHVRTLFVGAKMLVLAGSLPPGAPLTGLQHLVAAARAQELPAIVDARGEALRAALPAGPLLAKLNRAELSETVDRSCQSDDELITAALELRDRGAQAVLVTLGPAGAIAVDAASVWRVTHPSRSGNPIGAGDAFTAGVAVKLADGSSLPEALRQGAAAALASLRTPTAGRLDLSALTAARTQVDVRALCGTVTC